VDLKENKKLVLWKRRGLECEEEVAERWVGGEKEAMVVDMVCICINLVGM